MKMTNIHNLPAPFCRAIDWQSESHKMGGADISVTGMIDSPLVGWLKKKYKDSDQVTADYSGRVFALYGTIVHLILEKAGQRMQDEGEEVYPETRMEMECLGWTLTGMSDLVKKGDRLDDYKYTSAWSAKDVKRGGEKKTDYEKQTNVYLHMLKTSTDPALRAIGEGINDIRVLLPLRDWGPRFVKEGILPVEYIPLDVWAPEKAQHYIEERVRLHQAAQADMENPPPPCTSKETWRGKRCKSYCDYASVCERKGE